MSVLIGHASINEKGKVSGGVPGDQSGGEVTKRNWYDKNWDAILRPKRYKLALEMARICADICSNNFVGYDQPDRNSLYFYLKDKNFDISKIDKPLSCDCSSLMTFCAIAAGVNKLNYKTNAPTTRNMVKLFLETGEFEGITDEKYLKTDKYLEKGDILVSVGHHTVMALSDGEFARKKTESLPLYFGYVTCNSLCVRDYPRTGRLISYLYKGEKVYIYMKDVDSGWYNISDKGDALWVSNKYIRLEG